MLSHISRPTLVINEKTCRNNIRRMADKAGRSGVVIRPHFKTHQSLQVGEWFRDYAVTAITVSSVSMAIKFASAGWDDITVAFPANLRELKEINELGKEITLNLLCDSLDVVLALNAKLKIKIGLFIEIDTGYGRSGIHYSMQGKINEIVSGIKKSDLIDFKGFLIHAGNTYEATNTKEIKDIYYQSIEILGALKDMHSNALISVGDTPACSIIDNFYGADEIRPGNFVYYDLMQYYLGSCDMKDIAVTVACPVTGIYPERNEIVIYGGAVHLSKEFLEGKEKLFGLAVQYTAHGWTDPIPDTSLISISQEHGIIRTTPELISQIKHGDLIGILPVHSCLAADLLRDHELFI